MARATTRRPARRAPAAARRGSGRCRRSAPAACPRPLPALAGRLLRAGSPRRPAPCRRSRTTPRFEERTNSTTVRTSSVWGRRLRGGAAPPPGTGLPARGRGRPAAGRRSPRARTRGGAARPRFEPKKWARFPTVSEKGATSPRGDGGAAHERVRADPAELVDAREAPERREVVHLDVAGERGGVREDRVAPDEAVVGDVHLGHEQVVRPDAGEPPGPGGPPVDGRPLAEDVAVADLDAAGLSAELEVLRHEPDRAEREEAIVLAHARVALDHHVRVEHRPPTQACLVPDDAERPHLHARLEHGARRDPREGVDVGQGQRRHLEQQPGLGRARRSPAPRRGSGRDRPRRCTSRTSRRSWSPGTTGRRNFASSNPTTRISTRRGSGRLEQPDAGGLGERLEDERTAGHDRLRWEVAREEVPRPRSRSSSPRDVPRGRARGSGPRARTGTGWESGGRAVRSRRSSCGEGPRRVRARARRREGGSLPRRRARPAGGGALRPQGSPAPRAWGRRRRAPRRPWPSRPRRPSR